jgi:hypothetical protein
MSNYSSAWCLFCWACTKLCDGVLEVYQKLFGHLNFLSFQYSIIRTSPWNSNCITKIQGLLDYLDTKDGGSMLLETSVNIYKWYGIICLKKWVFMDINQRTSNLRFVRNSFRLQEARTLRYWLNSTLNFCLKCFATWCTFKATQESPVWLFVVWLH